MSEPFQEPQRLIIHGVLKAKIKKFKNAPFAGSINLILASFSNGNWYWLLTRESIKSAIFCHFIEKLNCWIFENKCFDYNDIVMTMDNCPSHKSKMTINTLSKNMKVRFLPVYSPDLAPTELCFGLLKSKLLKRFKTNSINLSKKDWNANIATVLKMMTSNKIKAFYSKFYEILNNYIYLF